MYKPKTRMIFDSWIMFKRCLLTSLRNSAMNVATDMTKGIIDRFRTMSITKSAVLIGHTGAGVVRNTISTITIIGTAFILGFKPKGGFADWVIVVGLLILVNIAISLLAVLCGLISKTVEGSSGLMLPLFIFIIASLKRTSLPSFRTVLSMRRHFAINLLHLCAASYA